MNSTNKVLSNSKDTKSGSWNKVTALNPNAAEFVPSSLKYTYETTKISDATNLDLHGSSRKVVLDRPESNNSNNSDDEVHQYWRQRLPDDITPDFEVIGEELHEPEHLTLAGLSIHDSVEQSEISGSMTSPMLDMQRDLSSNIGNVSMNGKMGYPGSLYGNEQSSISSMTSMSDLWGKPFVNGEDQEGHYYNGDYSAGILDDNMFLDSSVTNPIEFLSSQFPGFAAQSLADVYYGNECDLNLTIEILTQLELQVDNGFEQNLESKSLPAPNLSPLDFPALPVADTQNGLSKYGGDIQHGSSAHRSPGISRGEINFASTVKKLASQDSGHWKYDRNGSVDGSAGSSRSSQLLGSSYNGSSKIAYGDKWNSSAAVRSSPAWLETGEAVANVYSESREEARDLARLRNACFEQARQAYLIGNKALAKELSFKGQLYNMHMKAAHEKAKEAIYRKRNPVSSKIQGYGGEQDPLIDLHGLHVTEAIQVLNHELRALKNTARATGQRLRVMICVGTGHHTRGSRTPARLPVAVEQFLLEEGLHFTQPQPGLLSVVIY
ncbi:polyadenylate-binding protein-interacting protein 7-like isoform X1 [Canna indica]|uniref:Polyadenylate-binding protein-interacting protein 7-like isoform X1 n=1 Tax=Canna indica TaxID=4628 RepID=A0AAQ3K5D2_9LILI|nr:polyadenylate-binding protein-interacting protein 7-like isoform X1 [Canna indica]